MGFRFSRKMFHLCVWAAAGLLLCHLRMRSGPSFRLWVETPIGSQTFEVSPSLFGYLVISCLFSKRTYFNETVIVKIASWRYFLLLSHVSPELTLLHLQA